LPDDLLGTYKSQPDDISRTGNLLDQQLSILGHADFPGFHQHVCAINYFVGNSFRTLLHGIKNDSFDGMGKNYGGKGEQHQYEGMNHNLYLGLQPEFTEQR
jgi:hypothetical protein